MANSIALVATLLTLSLAGSASAQPLIGHWESGAGPTGAQLAFVVPEYSPNEFAIISISCDRTKRTVTITEDTGSETRPKTAAVSLLINGKHFLVRGKPWLNESNDSWNVDATVPYGSPVAVALKQVRAIGVDGAPHIRSLPMVRFARAHAQWLQACKLA